MCGVCRETDLLPSLFIDTDLLGSLFIDTDLLLSLFIDTDLLLSMGNGQLQIWQTPVKASP